MTSYLRWGILGAADIALGQVVPAIKASSNGIVTAIASRDPARARDFADAFSIPHMFGSYADLVASPEVDAVYIPLPNSFHAEWAVRAAEAGKAVLCEKPIALNANEAREAANGVAAAGMPLMEGFMYRFHPQNVHVLDRIREGLIGDVLEVRAHLSVDIMAHASGNVRFAKDLGGGSLLDMGCYTVNAARRLIGAEPTAALARFELDAASGVDVAASAILEFPRGATAFVSSSFKASGQGFYQVVGSKGVLEVPRAFIPGMGSRVAEGLVVHVDTDGKRSETRFAPVDHYRLMCEAFSASVLSNKPVPYSSEDAVANMRALDAIASAARSGKRVEI